MLSLSFLLGSEDRIYILVPSPEDTQPATYKKAQPRTHGSEVRIPSAGVEKSRPDAQGSMGQGCLSS